MMIKETKTNLPIDEALYEQGYNQAIKYLDNFDWQAFRREAAKDILCAILQRQYEVMRPVEHAIAIADELIKQLKMGEEE